jgi:hypothetical protein
MGFIHGMACSTLMAPKSAEIAVKGYFTGPERQKPSSRATQPTPGRVVTNGQIYTASDSATSAAVAEEAA